LLADRLAADVVVMGASAKGPEGARAKPLGGTAYSVVAQTCAPCLVVAQPLQLPLERIFVAIDISEPSRGALVIALSWASALRWRTDDTKTSLTGLHVEPRREGAPKGPSDKDAIDRELEAVRRSAGGWAGVSTHSVSRSSDDVPRAIAECAIAQRANLVVLGTRGLGADGTDRVGSVAAAVLSDLRAPVLVVPPAVWRDYAKDLQAEPDDALRGRAASAQDRDTGEPPGRRAE
jgi:nucleotide-binding universal stress UspA family protein